MSSNHYDSSKKKRVGKACDSCRLKKTKCNGKQPCERCTLDNKICIYTERKKSKDKIYSSEYVELIDRRLNLVNKSLLKLCEMVKLNKKDELLNFIAQLDYNKSDEVSPISVNQAISLLIDHHELEVDRKEFSASTITKDSLNRAELKSQLSALNRSSSSRKSSKSKNILTHSLVLPSEGSIMLSSPESLSPRSSDISLSYHNNFANCNHNPNNGSSTGQNQNQNQCMHISNKQLPSVSTSNLNSNSTSNCTSNSTPNSSNSNSNSNSSNNNISLTKIKEEDESLSMSTRNFDSIPLSSSYSTFDTNSNLVSPTEEIDDVAMMGFNTLDLGHFRSNNINLLSNSPNINTNILKNSISNASAVANSIKDLSSLSVSSQGNEISSPVFTGSSFVNCFSPSSITSDSSTMPFSNMNDVNNDSTPILMSSANSFIDNLSISPPPALIKRTSSVSTIGSGSIRKVQHHSHHSQHSHHHQQHVHNLSHNNNDHVSISNDINNNSSNIISDTLSSSFNSKNLPTSSLSPSSSNFDISSSLQISPILPTSLTNDLNMHYTNEEFVQF